MNEREGWGRGGRGRGGRGGGGGGRGIILSLEPVGSGCVNPCLQLPSIHSKVEQFLFKVFEGVYVRIVTLARDGKKLHMMKAHHKLESSFY